VRRWLDRVLLGAALVAVAPDAARADGAFPDSLGVFVPADRPESILVATNFGVLVSADAGATWFFVCERVVGPYAAPYQMGPPPDDRLLAVTWEGLSYSTDLACSWQRSTGPLSSPTDVFPDPTDPARVFAIGSGVVAEEGAVSALFESADGGATFGEPILWAPSGAFLNGVEVARSDPAVVTVSMYGAPAQHASLSVSHDSCATWQTLDLSPSLGTALVRIAAIDPEDPERVFLRVQDGSGRDRLAIATEGGAQVEVPLELSAAMTSFLLRSDGALIVGTSADEGAFLSEDGGETFAPWPNAPHLRAIGERDGRLYAVGDNFVDGFAVAVSDDLGATWQPLMRYQDLRGVLGCGTLESDCAADWAQLQVLFGIDPDDPPDPPDPDGPAWRPRGGGCAAVGRVDEMAYAGALAPLLLLAIGRRSL